jgi:intracellular septation protein
MPQEPTPDESPAAPATTRPAPNPLAKLAIEAGPLAAFFIANAKFNIYVATGTFMVAIVLSLGASWRLERRLPVMPLVTAAFVLVFGGLTLYLQDDTFIKLKPTIVNLLFAATLLVGLAMGRPLMRVLLGEAMQLDESGWRKLTLRWGLFFVALAGLNELVWRSFSTDTWVSFKVFGIMPLTILFTLTQLPLINRHMIAQDEPAGSGE